MLKAIFMGCCRAEFESCNNYCSVVVAFTGHSPLTVDMAKTFKLEAVLQSIHYYRCHDYVELVALTHLLPQITAEKPKVPRQTATPPHSSCTHVHQHNTKQLPFFLSVNSKQGNLQIRGLSACHPWELSTGEPRGSV